MTRRTNFAFSSSSQSSQRSLLLLPQRQILLILVVLLCNVISLYSDVSSGGGVDATGIVNPQDDAHVYQRDEEVSSRTKRQTQSPGPSSETVAKKQVTKKPTTMEKNKEVSKSPLPVKSASLSAASTSSSASTAGVESSSPLSTSVVSNGDMSGDKNKYDSAASGVDDSEALGPLPDDDNIPTPPSTEKEQEDNHTYYKSEFLEGPLATSLWIDLDEAKEKDGSSVKRHEMLSNSHRRAATVQLSFDFPFYGYPLKNITIATGGFLYLGDHVHSWLAATQYIAPLMANFDTSLSNDSHVIYADNGTAFTVEWRHAHIQEKLELGNFTFQVTLKSNGDVIFAYRSIPVAIGDIPEVKHPVKVGIADAYVVDRTVFFIRRRTLYEYHRVSLKDYPIKNDSAIIFKPLPTCISMKSCGECTRANETNPGLECRWCEALGRCSDGMDRSRQQWTSKGCDRVSVKSPDTCPAPGSIPSSSTTTGPGSSQSGSSASVIISGSTSAPSLPYDSRSAASGSSIGGISGPASRDQAGGAGILSFLVIIAMMSGVAVWILYAYRNPQTSSGQFLIKYRPSRWRFNGSEARYSAASIHM